MLAPQCNRACLAGLALAAVLSATAALGSTERAIVGATAAPTKQELSGVKFDGKTYTNRLIDSQDPYLLLHAHNPVDWHPWGSEALALARREHKPIFLSVGYSTCYWCHVAEREIYSNPEIAALMNQWFVNIKVDREQRPDVDRIYMLATQLMTGGGGWPNNVFMTPELKPFFAGSYFPPQDQAGRPGFTTILTSLHHAWTNEQAKVLAVGERMHQALKQIDQRTVGAAPEPDPAGWRAQAVREMTAQFDAVHAGFSGGGTTLFPQEPYLALLLAAHVQDGDRKSLEMASAALQAMALGGLMDQLGGGFHRYSTEPSWSVPHFEKMLYNNAQLLGLYADAFAATRNPLFKQVASRTAHYLRTRMQAPDGGFYGAEDAEIDGVEGASYVWSEAEIEAVLGTADAKRFLALYQLTPMPAGFPGHRQPEGGVLRLQREQAELLAGKQQLAATLEALAPLRDKLLKTRAARPQPARDEKIVTADNALAMLGFVQAGQALGDPALVETAAATARVTWARAYDAKTGELWHQFFRGHASGAGFLDDYALLGQAFLALHVATGDAVWQTRAQQIGEAMLKRFARADGSLASVSASADLLVAPPTEGDSVQPSGHSAAIAVLLALPDADQHYAGAARRALTPLAAQIAARPSGWGALLAALSEPARIAALAKAPRPVTTSGLPNSADFVHASAEWQKSERGFELVARIDIDPGYHINANPASDQDLIPTELRVAEQPALQIDYPPGQNFQPAFARQGIAVYAGHLELRARAVQTQTLPKSAWLRVQTCNDQSCLAPDTIEIAITAPRVKE